MTRSESWSRPAEARGWAGAALLGAALLALAWWLLHVGVFARDQIVDTGLYRQYGDAMVAGRVPYRDFSLEYPPGALPAFLLPALAAADDYRTVFEWLMLACGLGTVACVAWGLGAAGASRGRLYAGAALAGVAPLALGSVVLTRFDLWPAFLTAAALAALVSGRSRTGLGLLAAATATKVYPLVVLPLAFAHVWRRRGRREALAGLAAFAAVLAAIVVPFLLIAPDGVWERVTRQTGRPLQIESLGAAFLLAAHRLGLYDAHVSTLSSQNLDGGLADAVASVLTGLQVVAIAGVWALFGRGAGDRGRLLVGAAAAVAAFVAFGKVLSPQYLVWLVPVVALALAEAGAAVFVLLAAALVLTQLWFPFRYWDLVALGPEAWLVLARDLVLVGLVGALAVRARRAAPRTP